MVRSSKKASRSRKKSTRGAKMLISAAAIAVTFGGWAAMAANDEWASAAKIQTQAQAQTSTLTTTQTSAQSGLNTQRIADMASAQPPTPFLMTHSSR